MPSIVTENAEVQEIAVVHDRFTPIHILLQLAVFTLFFFSAELDRIFKLYLLLVPLIGIPVIVVGIIWITAITSNLIKKRWRLFASAIAAPFVIWLLITMLTHWDIDSQWVRFQINKRSYEETINSLAGAPHRYYSWDWGSTGGAGVVNIFQTLKYDESDQIDPRNGKYSAGAFIEIKNFGNHYYLITEIY